MPEIGSRRGYGANGKAVSNTTVLLPELRIGGHRLTQIPCDLEEPSNGAGLPFNIVGNEVLKRFNVILDFQTGMIYLKPNSLQNIPYDTPFSKWYLVWVGVAILLIVFCVVIAILRRKRLQRV